MKEKTSFNFARRWEEELYRATRTRAEKRQRTVVMILLAALLAGLLASPWAWAYKLSYDTTKLEEQIAALGKIDEEVQRRDALQAQVQSQEQVQDLVANNTQDPAIVLAQLAEYLPAGTTVTNFSLRADNSFTVGLTLPTPVDVARLWVSLEESGLYEGVNIQTVSLEDKSQTLNLYLKLKQ